MWNYSFATCERRACRHVHFTITNRAVNHVTCLCRYQPHGFNKRPVGLLSFAPFGPFWVRGEDSGQCLGSNWCFWRCGKNDEAIHRGKWLQLLTHLPLEKSRHFGDNILWCILVNEKYHILIKSYSELEESLDFLIVSCFNVSIFLIKEFATLVRPCFE